VAAVETLVGRQPIFDRDMAVKAYELVFRSYDEEIEAGRPQSAHIAPAELLGSSTGGIEALVGTKKAFCNADLGMVTGAVPIVAPPDRVVVEIGAHMIRGDVAMDGCRRLLADGYKLAIDDFHLGDGNEQLLELASIVKIDVQAMQAEQLPGLMEQCRQFEVELIAQRVDTREELSRCTSLGFDYFQGYLLSRPHAVPGRPLAPGRLAGLRMSAKLLDAECPISDIEEIVRSDPAMSHQLLQLSGIGAAGGMRRTVRTIREALVLVGWRRLQSWVALLLLTDDGTASEEEIAAVLMRARMSELLAPAAGCSSDAGYTAGLLSTLDVVLGMSIERILETLPLDQELHDAILSGEGALGHLVADVADYQLGRQEQAHRSALGDEALRTAAVDAITWTVGMTSALNAVGPA
jgi:EAL and modified HD-GYP domain-containing signal transduction protein